MKRKTTTELSPQGWTGGMTAIYQGKEYDVITVDFDEDLIGIDFFGDGEPSFKRCESIEKVMKNKIINP